jgi:hypothetical protein
MRIKYHGEIRLIREDDRNTEIVYAANYRDKAQRKQIIDEWLRKIKPLQNQSCEFYFLIKHDVT